MARASGNSRQEPTFTPPTNQLEVDIAALATVIAATDPPGPDAFAPPAVRAARLPDPVAKTIEGFAASPIAELDALADAARAEADSIVNEARIICDDFRRRTAELTQRVKLLTSKCAASKGAMVELRNRLAEMDGDNSQEGKST